MKTDHKYQEAIIAWINGEKIQYNYDGRGWVDYRHSFNDVERFPAFNDPNHQWRVKTRRWYRISECNDGSLYLAYDEKTEEYVETSAYFYKWRTERIYLDD